MLRANAAIRTLPAGRSPVVNGDGGEVITFNTREQWKMSAPLHMGPWSNGWGRAKRCDLRRFLRKAGKQEYGGELDRINRIYWIQKGRVESHVRCSMFD